MPPFKIAQAAFKDKAGKIFPTGPFHDILALPENTDIADEGFVDHVGKYYSRKEATQMMGTGHQVQSQELHLPGQQSHQYSFSPPQTVDDKIMETRAHYNNEPIGHLRYYAKPVSEPGHPHEGYHRIAGAEINPMHRGKGVYGKLLQHVAGYLKTRGSKGLVSVGVGRTDAAGRAWSKLSGRTSFKQLGGVGSQPDFMLNEQELNKVMPTPKFPKLGMPEDRRETPMVGPGGAKVKTKLINYATGGNVQDRPRHGLTLVGGNTHSSFATRLPSKLHEDTHQMFNRVQEKYGHDGRKMLMMNLWFHVPDESRQAMKQYVGHQYNGKQPPPLIWHEEHLAHLIGYLNTPEARKKFHQKNLHFEDVNNNILNQQGIDFQSKMKTGYHAIRRAAQMATPDWTKGAVKGPSQVLKHEEWYPTLSEELVATQMLGQMHAESPEFKAAKFLANQYQPTEDEIAIAWVEWEGDPIAAALHAHKLPVTQANVKALKDIIRLQELDEPSFSKAELEVAAIPRLVKPFDKRSEGMAVIIQNAFKARLVVPIKLGGKHTSGAALAKDPHTDKLWLLKPGSGKLSPSLGIREQNVSQSRREVAFNVCGSLMGLKRYLPHAYLLLLDSNEVACLEFISSKFETLDKMIRSTKIDPIYIFQPYVESGTIFKWSTLDYLLGMPDRHKSNIMINKEHDVKLIDAGTTFAGYSFNPGKDPKSFIPSYLRSFTKRKFNVLTPEERYGYLPFSTKYVSDLLKYWIDGLPDGQIVRVLNQYGIDPGPFLKRLEDIRNYPGSKIEFLNKFYSTLLDKEKEQLANA